MTDARCMTRVHDPRPAARYQAVTPSSYSQNLGSHERPAAREPVAASGSRVLRHVPTRLMRLDAVQ